MHIKVGTRGSKLALAQTNYVVDRLKAAYPENEYEIVVITTKGDIDLTKPLESLPHFALSLLVARYFQSSSLDCGVRLALRQSSLIYMAQQRVQECVAIIQ